MCLVESGLTAQRVLNLPTRVAYCEVGEPSYL